jgi:hypothetical protein
MTKEKFKLLQEKISNIIKIDQDNLEQDIIKTLEIIKILTEIYFKELRILRDLEDKYNKLFKEKYHNYRWNSEEALSYNEIINIYLKGDNDLVELNVSKREIELQIDEIQKHLETLKSKQWAIKDYISWRKFMSGD